MKTILVVDDSETMRMRLSMDMQEAGFKTIEAVNGLDAIDKIAQNPEIHLIVCDVNMPKMDGISMCREIKKNNMTNQPILMMTTETDPKLKESGKEVGVRAWITKPYSKERVVKVIGKLIGTE